MSGKNIEITKTQTSYNCEQCNDTGWIIIPQEKMQPIMRRCQCAKDEITKKQWEACGLNPSSAQQTFTNFKIWNASSSKGKTTGTEYYKKFESIKSTRRNSIIFCGQVGSGKTHLSIAIALNLLKKGKRVVYMPYRDVITSLKQNMIDEEFYKKTISKYQKAQVLLLDDLFKGKINETDINIMFEIVNYRYLNNLPLIVSTEKSIEELLDFDEAVASRIYEMCKDFIVEIVGRENNYRMR